MAFHLKGMEEVEEIIPQWNKDLVKERLEEYNNNPSSVLGFDESMDEIYNEL